MITLRSALRYLSAAALAAVCIGAWSDEAAIRKAWAQRNPKAAPIEEVTKTPIAGLYELRVGSEIVYSDEKGDYLIFPSHDVSDGHLIDTRSHVDLTDQRMRELLAMDIPKLPYKDAIQIRQGNGSRRLIVFEDPNCHYCRDVEKSLVALKDVTVYTFLIPILGPDSVTKARDIWCSRDNARTWRTWMLDGNAPMRSMGQCDTTALDRNLALANKYRVNGTPGIFFEDGFRFNGAVDFDHLQTQLNQSSAKKG